MNKETGDEESVYEPCVLQIDVQDMKVDCSYTSIPSNDLAVRFRMVMYYISAENPSFFKIIEYKFLEQ
jgi:hypothetical protein